MLRQVWIYGRLKMRRSREGEGLHGRGVLLQVWDDGVSDRRVKMRKQRFRWRSDGRLELMLRRIRDASDGRLEMVE